METDFEMSEADRAVMAQAEVQIRQEMEAETLRCQQVLDQVRGLVGAEHFAEIQACIGDSDYTCDYKLTDKASGKVQDDDYSFGPYFIDQTTNGGFTGDDFQGTVYVPVGAGKFFSFGYAM